MRRDSLTRRIADRLSGDSWKLLASALVVHFLCALMVSELVLHDFPNSADEYAYVISATLFAEGRLRAPSPPLREFFDSHHIVNDGHFYGKYPPGWPALLALGVLTGAPRLVNPILSCLTLVIVHRLARQRFSTLVGNIAVLLAAVSPFMVFNAASYFAHPSCLLFCASAFYCWAGRATPSLSRTALGSASLSAAFLIRPYTAVLLGVPLVVWLIWSLRSQLRLLLSRIAVALLAAAPFVAIFLGYNYLQTGDPFLQPFSIYDPADHPRLPATKREWRWLVEHNITDRLVRLVRWCPFVIVVGLALLFRRRTRKNDRTDAPGGVGILIAAFVVQFLGQLFYLRDAWNQYGPRYQYESLFALLILSAVALSRLSRRGLVAGLLVAAVANVAVGLNRATFHGKQVEERTELYRIVNDRGLRNAIVIIENGSGTMAPGDLTRNGTRFDGAVLYVQDKQERNAELLGVFPDRRYFYYSYERKFREGESMPSHLDFLDEVPDEGTGRLTPLRVQWPRGAESPRFVPPR